MILKTLCDYYDLLTSVPNSNISPYGFQEIPANYVAILSKEGRLVEIISLKELNDNHSQMFRIPKSMKKSCIASSLVCDNFEYIFGVGGDKGVKTTETIKNETSKNLHLELFKNAVSLEAVAIKHFFETWDNEKAWENEQILKHYSEKGKAFSGNIVFRLEGNETYFHETPEIIEIWKNENKRKLAEEGGEICQCSVTGKKATVALLHSKFNGVKGAISTNAPLVSFNKDSFVSYGLKQSKNSAVSEEAAFKYHTALQYMLSDWERKIQIGDATTVFWAEKMDEQYTSMFKCILNNPDDLEEGTIEDIKTRNAVKSILADGSKGIYNDTRIDQETKFYILGLSPNAGRLSVRFFYQDSFGNFCDRIKQHYDDIAIDGGSHGKPYINIGSLLNATVSSNSQEKQGRKVKKKVNPLLAGAVTRAILTGEIYPRILLNQAILRVKTEAKAKSWITQPRVSIIKGYLNRKKRMQRKKEEFTMYLDEKSVKPAYVLGRTFAILEMIQKNALGDELNATIKDKYFASACSNPSLAFPNLLKLAQHHLAKIEGKNWDIKLGECLALLEGDSFPKILDMENQGRFILGYYQQTQKNYEKKEVISVC